MKHIFLLTLVTPMLMFGMEKHTVETFKKCIDHGPVEEIDELYYHLSYLKDDDVQSLQQYAQEREKALARAQLTGQNTIEEQYAMSRFQDQCKVHLSGYRYDAEIDIFYVRKKQPSTDC